MSEEEKELIKELERKSNLVATECEIFIERSELFTILNLIDKLQKENEQLKEENFDQVYMKAIADYKEKIRNKIKELEEIYNNTDTLEIDKRLMINAEIIVLNELLGE